MAMHFDLTDMQLMINIADSRSLTRGAEKSHLSLPAASTRVKNLEEHFTTRLLYRTSQGVTLTPSGQALVRHARSIMGQIESMRGEMQEFGSGLKGHIRVLANTTAMTEFMPQVLQRFLTTHPDVNVELRERLSYLVIKAIAEGSADIGIVAGCPASGNVQFLPYRNDRLVLVTPARHPLSERQAVDFADTLAYNYVGLSEWSAIHPFLLQAATNLGLTFKFRVEVGNFEAVCRMIESHVGIGVIPGSVAKRFQHVMDLRVVPLTDAWAERRLHVCVRDLQSLPGFAQDLVQLLVQDAAAEESTAPSAERGARTSYNAAMTVKPNPPAGPQRVVLASNNAGKLREFSQLLAPRGLTLVPQAELHVSECPEPYGTFVENALTKARHASRITGLPALSDDSGLCVAALNGAPGVQSARYAQTPDGIKSDAANNAKLIADLRQVADRRAYFVAVLVFVRGVDDPRPIISEGVWHGSIVDQPRGQGGFGYDPHFLVNGMDRTAAELDAAQKNRFSHRACALRELLGKLQDA